MTGLEVGRATAIVGRSVPRDISTLSYGRDGVMLEEVARGEALGKFCRRSAGADARYVPPAPWEV